ncbi:MAG: hypothetical protein QGH29_03575 [Kiritimatiellia bacterium]|jgi:hypothetical protein|nr:hypothetical protein [Kiritimatiellia bacterium]
MSCRLYPYSISVSLLIGIAQCTTHAREWVSVSGDILEASYVSLEKGNGPANVILENPSGKRFKVELDKLCRADREYVRSKGHPQPRFRATETEASTPISRSDIQTMLQALPAVDIGSSQNAIAMSIASLVFMPLSLMLPALIMYYVSQMVLGFRPKQGVMYRATLKAGVIGALSQIGGLVALAIMGHSSIVATLAVAVASLYVFILVLGHSVQTEAGQAIGFMNAFRLWLMGLVVMLGVTLVLAIIPILLMALA